MKKKILAAALAALLCFSSFPASSIAQGLDNPFSALDNARQQAVTLATQRGQARQADALGTQQESNDSAPSDASAYLVQFKSSASLDEIYQCVSQYPFRMLAQSSERLFSLSLADPAAFRQRYAGIIAQFAKSVTRSVSATPNDPYYTDQWAIPDIGLDQAWDQTKGSASIKVAVIDTGLYRAHEDLSSPQILSGYDVCTSTSNVSTDGIGHGTMVTSVIAATTNNATGIAGGCWNVSIVPYKVADSRGSISSTDMITAIRMAADAGCDVINISLGGNEQDSFEQSAVNYAVSKGCIVIAAAGNDGSDAGRSGAYDYPASDDNVVSVASVGSGNTHSTFSQHNDKVEISAPGEQIYVASSSGTNRYAIADGTSFSSPYVAAVAALTRSVEKTVTAPYFEQLLQQTSTDLGDTSKDNYYGWGLINAKKMVQAAQYPVVCGVENGSVYSSARQITFNKGTATLNGQAFSSGTTVSASGSYALSVTDTSGHTTNMTFYIDSTALAVNGISDGGVYNTSRTITYNGVSATLNGAPFTSGSSVSAEGSYTLVVKGTYGNTATWHFTIDKTPPAVTGVQNGKTYTGPVTISFNEGTATLNGAAFSSGGTVSYQNTYHLVVTDTAGNVTAIDFSISNDYAGGTKVSMPTTLGRWVLDTTNGRLFAISKTTASLLCLNSQTLATANTVSLGAVPTDIAESGGMLYIALDSLKQIAVVNAATATIVKTIPTMADPNRLAVDGNTLYYVQAGSAARLYTMDLTTGIDTAVSADSVFPGTAASPVLAVNTQNHTVFLSESGSATSKIYSYSKTTGKFTAAKQIDVLAAHTAPAASYCDGSYVYCGAFAFTADSALTRAGDYGDGTQPVLFAGGNVAITAGGVYDRQSHVKAGSLISQVALATFSDTGALYLYDQTNACVVLYQSAASAPTAAQVVLLVSGVPAATIPSVTTGQPTGSPGETSLAMKSSLTNWLQDDSTNTLYAVSGSAKALFFINSVTLGVEKTVFLPSAPTDLCLSAGKLYVNMEQAQQIAVFDTAAQQQTKTLYTSAPAHTIGIDGQSLFYATSGSTALAYRYNLSNDTDSRILDKTPLVSPSLAVDPSLHMLYLGSNDASPCLYYYNTSSLSLIGSAKVAADPARPVVCDGTMVYWGRYAMDASDPAVTPQKLSDDTGEYALAAQNGLIITNKAVYLEITLSSISSLSTTASLAALNSNFYSYVLFLYDAAHQVILRQRDASDPPQVSGVTDGAGYLKPVTITFDTGTATLDGQPFANGGTVSAVGAHDLIVTDADNPELSTTVHFTIYAAQADDGTAVTFTDSSLKAALIDNGVDTDNNGVITRGELRVINSLALSSAGITSLSGLEYAVNLTALSVSDNTITDLTPLSGMSKLQTLDVSQNQVTGLSPLAGLTALNSLDASSNSISDLAPLSGLVSLGKNDGQLNLSGNAIGNITPLASLVSLTALSLSNNQITDISALSALTALNALDLSSNNVSSVNALSGLKKLGTGDYGYLSLANNAISSVAPLAGLTDMTGLDLSFNPVADFSPIAGLTKLTGLALEGDNITNPGFLQGLTALNYLDLAGNSIANAGVIGSLSQLNTLILDGNNISDSSFLSSLTQLAELSISNNQISNLSPLQSHVSLAWLDLSGNRIQNVSVLAGLYNLANLDLSGNQISDAGPLANLNGLYFLSLAGNNIQDITPVGSLQNLTVLDLSNNRIEFVDALAGNVWFSSLNLSGNSIGDISPLQNCQIDEFDVSNNFLDLTAGSTDMTVIQGMQAQNPYMSITYSPQKPLSQDVAPVISVSPYNTSPTNQNITVTVSSDKGRLNTTSHTFTQNGSFTFTATDGAGKQTSKTVTITNIDKTPPVISIAPYNTAPSTGPITVYASCNEGSLNAGSHTFTQNGSFTFVATDAAGNSSSSTVTVSNIVSVKSGDINGDGNINVLDLLSLKKYLLHQVSLSDNGRSAADVNHDGKIDVLDLLKLKKYLLHQINL